MWSPENGILVGVERVESLCCEVVLRLLNAFEATHNATFLHDRLFDVQALNLNVWGPSCFVHWLLLAGCCPFARLQVVARIAAIHVEFERELFNCLKLFLIRF